MGYAIIPYFEGEKAASDYKADVRYCKGDCKHTDCAEVRKLRASKCEFCKKGFEAGDKYFCVERGIAHAICTYEKFA